MNRDIVAVLLPTHNGAKFIRDQIESIINQKEVNVHFYISDDGSSDDTLKILDKYFKKYPSLFKSLYKVNFYHPVKNYISLALKVPTYKYYAFTDQDDVWFEDKLIHAIKKLKEGNSIYCGRTRVTDENLNPIGYSPLFLKPACFANAIAQNIAGANTMVIDNTIMTLFKNMKDHPITSIDWSLYLLATFNDYKVFYDKNPKIFYRQHSQNDHGIGSTAKQRIKNLLFLISGKMKKFNDLNFNFLISSANNKNSKNLQILYNYNNLRKNFAFNFTIFKLLKKTGVYRQTFFGNLNLKISIFLGLE